MEILPRVIEGIANFKLTYKDDAFITSRCNVIIDGINSIVNSRDYDVLSSNNFVTQQTVGRNPPPPKGETRECNAIRESVQTPHRKGSAK